MQGMRQIQRSALVLAFLAAPSLAQDLPDEEAPSLMERGAQLFLKGLAEEMGPALDDLRGLADGAQPALRQFVDEMGPALADLLGRAGDLSAYHPPEMLPNGDIIIRRKTPDEAPADPLADPSAEIEL